MPGLTPSSCQHQQSVYQQFLQILQRYKEEGFAIARVKAQVREGRERMCLFLFCVSRASRARYAKRSMDDNRQSFTIPPKEA